MPQTDPWRTQRLSRLGNRRILLHEQFRGPGNGSNLLHRDRAGPIDQDRRGVCIEHSRFDSKCRRPGIHHRIDAPIQILEHMFSRRRAGMPKPVRARRGNRHPGAPNYLQRHRVPRHADSHQRPPCSHRIRDLCRSRQQQRQRPRPESTHQPPRRLRHIANHRSQHRLIRHMHNQRIPARTLLGRKNRRHSLQIQRIRAQPIDCLGRQRHRSAAS